MKKIPTVFVREFKDHHVCNILNEFTNEECKDAFLNGIPTIKIDGSCCAIIDGIFYKRYDAKKGKPIPEGAIKCQDEPDPVTGHLPCWIRCDRNNKQDKWFWAAYDNYIAENGKIDDWTYEAIGPHFQGNPYNLDEDFLNKHGQSIFNLKRTFNDVKEWLENYHIEGIVFWKDQKPVCKIKRSDFCFKWP